MNPLSPTSRPHPQTSRVRSRMHTTGSQNFIGTARMYLKSSSRLLVLCLFHLSVCAVSLDHRDDDGVRDPLLLRVARGEVTDQTPVWMMRQAGRHMQVYRDLISQYPTFRERSETPEISLAISLQPFEAYGVDGCILFSDILTPLPTMGIEFDISEAGGISIEPIRHRKDIKRLKLVTKEHYFDSCSFVGSVLESLRAKVPTEGGTVLGFIGLPFTVGSYLIEGKTGVKDEFQSTTKLMKRDPGLVHELFGCLAKNLAEYSCYQVESGAQILQVFDSWAGHVDDEVYKTFCLPYQQQVINMIKKRCPETPIIIYMAPGPFSSGGRRLDDLARSGADMISIDHTTSVNDACARLPKHLGIQGNLDPQILRDGPLERIHAEVKSIIDAMDPTRPYIMNLGHGILSDTPEPHAAFFVKTVQEYKRR